MHNLTTEREVKPTQWINSEMMIVVSMPGSPISRQCKRQLLVKRKRAHSMVTLAERSSIVKEDNFEFMSDTSEDDISMSGTSGSEDAEDVTVIDDE